MLFSYQGSLCCLHVALGDSLFIISQCFSFVNNFFQFFSNIFLSCFFHCFKCFCTTYPHLCVNSHIAAWMQSLHSFEYSKKAAAFSLYSHHTMHFLCKCHFIQVFASWSQHFSGSGYSTPSVSTVIFAMTWGVRGRSLKPVGTQAIALTASMPSTTFPNAAYCPSR